MLRPQRFALNHGAAPELGAVGDWTEPVDERHRRYCALGLISPQEYEGYWYR